MPAPPLGYSSGVLPQGASDQRQVQYILNLVSDIIIANTIKGVSIYGGAPFTDTLGYFYPVVISAVGGITLNASTTTRFMTFHDTASVNSDILIGLGSGALFIDPSQVTTIGNTATLVISDRAANPYQGFVFYPGYTGGPRLYWSDGAGGFTPAFIAGANYMYISGGAASTAPTIVAGGTDANVWIYLQPKGSGTVGFQYAATALGGGAAPTLGTIGGSGPATAAQSAWLAVVINSTNYWIPVWR